jgi:hypothetical protein
MYGCVLLVVITVLNAWLRLKWTTVHTYYCFGICYYYLSSIEHLSTSRSSSVASLMHDASRPPLVRIVVGWWKNLSGDDEHYWQTYDYW